MKTMKSPWIWTIMMGIACCMASCTSCTKEKPYFGVTSDLKSLCNYTVGSYWIMEDSLSGEIDSFYVVSKAKRNLDINNGASIQESIDIRINQQNVVAGYEGKYFNLQLTTGAYLQKLKDGKDGGWGYVFDFKQAGNDHDTTVHAILYHHCVINFDFVQIPPPANYWNHFNIANENAGFIKLRFVPSDDEHIWELIRYSKSTEQ